MPSGISSSYAPPGSGTVLNLFSRAVLSDNLKEVNQEMVFLVKLVRLPKGKMLLLESHMSIFFKKKLTSSL